MEEEGRELAEEVVIYLNKVTDPGLCSDWESNSSSDMLQGYNVSLPMAPNSSSVTYIQVKREVQFLQTRLSAKILIGSRHSGVVSLFSPV